MRWSLWVALSAPLASQALAQDPVQPSDIGVGRYHALLIGIGRDR